MRCVCLILPALLMTGCWSGSADFGTMQDTIDAMENESSSVRERAQKAAEKKVGSGVKFRPHDSAQRRQEEIERYRRLHQLAQEHGETHFIDLVPQLLEQMDDSDLEVRKLAGQDIVQLTNVSYGYQADAPVEERRAVIKQYRADWQKWSAPGSRVLEFKRHPEKLRDYKRQRIEEMKRQAAAG